MPASSSLRLPDRDPAALAGAAQQPDQPRPFGVAVGVAAGDLLACRPWRRRRPLRRCLRRRRPRSRAPATPAAGGRRRRPAAPCGRPASSEPSPALGSNLSADPLRIAESAMWRIGCQWALGMIRSTNSDANQSSMRAAITGSFATLPGRVDEVEADRDHDRDQGGPATSPGRGSRSACRRAASAGTSPSIGSRNAAIIAIGAV